jgi:hypothetical protein
MRKSDKLFHVRNEKKYINKSEKIINKKYFKIIKIIKYIII